MTSMIEKVATAIAKTTGHGWIGSVSATDFKAARAVLNVLREPDEGMLETFDYYEKRETDTHVEGSWQDAIDHILEGEDT